MVSETMGALVDSFSSFDLRLRTAFLASNLFDGSDTVGDILEDK